MYPTLTAWLACLVVASAAALAVYCGSGYASAAFNAIHTDIADKLRRLRVSTRGLRELLIVWLVVLAGTLAGFWILLDSPVFGVLTAVLMSCGPWYLLRRMAQRHHQRIEDQLADAMVMLSNAVRAGLSLAQSMEILAAQCPKPINAEFHQIVAEYKMGKPLERTLREAKERLRSENFALFAAALLASHESGGRLNETVERIAQSVLELQRLDRKIQSETAQARKSAVYMGSALFLILPIYYLIEPHNTAKLFTTVVGQTILAIALVLNLIAYLWARVILNPDI